MAVEVRDARPDELGEARALVEEYVESLGIDLGFQDIEREVADLPGMYSPPTGCLLLALKEERAVGCVAVRALEDDCCELKRLYVRPEARGSGAGRALTEAAVARAKELGYRRMRLDTLPTMGPARELYRSAGFREIEPYRMNPVAGTSFMERELS